MLMAYNHDERSTEPSQKNLAISVEERGMNYHARIDVSKSLLD